jgi:hypothetical protein
MLVRRLGNVIDSNGLQAGWYFGEYNDLRRMRYLGRVLAERTRQLYNDSCCA